MAARSPNVHGHMHRDVASQTVLCHMNFLLSQFVPKWYFDAWVRYLEVTNSHMGEKCGTESASTAGGVIAGSMNDGVMTPNIQPRGSGLYPREHVEVKGDLDYLHMLNVTADYSNDHSDSTFIIDTSTSYPGYFRPLWNKIPTEPVDNGRCFAAWMNKEIGPSEYIPRGRIGPALIRPKKTPGEANIDHVLTGKCIRWPLEAEMWRTRNSKTGWPSQSLKEDICSRGCHFVFKSHRSSRNPSSECRFSFIDGESKLMATLSSEQKRCFVVFKMLVKYVLTADSAITSYCLKTTLFWTLEIVPSDVWEDPVHGMALGFLQLLDKLIRFLVDRCMPQYFIPENNLIQHIGTLERRSDLRNLTKLRCNPLQTALEHDGKYNITGTLLAQEELSVLFPGTVNQFKMNRCTRMSLTECLELHCNETTSYFVYSIQTLQSTRAAFGVLKSLQHYDVLAGRPKRDLVQLVYDRLVQTSDIYDQIIIAIICSMVFLKSVDEIVDPEMRSERQTLVDRAFLRILSQEMHSIIMMVVIVYYVLFLVQCKELPRAVVWLKRGLKAITAERLLSEKFPEMCVLSVMSFEYLNDMADVLDVVLQILINDDPFVKISAPSLAYHLLVELYMKLNMPKQAAATTVDFELFCNSSIPQSTTKDGLSGYGLLAFSYMTIGDYSSAERAFKTHTRHLTSTERGSKPKNKYLTEKIYLGRANICKAIAMDSDPALSKTRGGVLLFRTVCRLGDLFVWIFMYVYTCILATLQQHY